MSELAARIKTFVLEVLGPRAETMGISREELAGDFNLMQSGLLDSMGFVDLVAQVENEFDVQMDLMDLDPSQFTSLSGFVSRVAASREQS
jgi:acyl carrier protein